MECKTTLFNMQSQHSCKPVMMETWGFDTKLLGELLTLQGVFQDSNCDLGTFVGKFETDEVVKSGVKAETFSGERKIKMLFDSGTSKTMSAHKEDFVKLTPLWQAKPIQGVGSGVTPQGKGLVRFVL